MKNTNILPSIRRKVKEMLNNYVSSLEIVENIDRYLVPPGLGVLYLHIVCLNRYLDYVGIINTT
jgi:hypothetical protein